MVIVKVALAQATRQVNVALIANHALALVLGVGTYIIRPNIASITQEVTAKKLKQFL